MESWSPRAQSTSCAAETLNITASPLDQARSYLAEPRHQSASLDGAMDSHPTERSRTADIARGLIEHGFDVTEIAWRQESLENVFLGLTSNEPEGGMTARFAILTELRVLWRRPGTWILLGIWLLMAICSGMSSLTSIATAESPAPVSGTCCPIKSARPPLSGFPFFGGVLVLILAVMTFRRRLRLERGQDTADPASLPPADIRKQVRRADNQPDPVRIAGFRLGPIVASEIVARAQSKSRGLESLADLAVSMLAAWLILAVWSALGVLLATLTRGTSLAIGIGILYGLVFEGKSLEPVAG